MPRWSKADLTLLAELRSRHTAANIAREAEKVPAPNRKRGRPRYKPDDVTLNALVAFREVEIRMQGGHGFIASCNYVAKEATAHGYKLSGRSVRAMHAAAVKWLDHAEPGRRKARVLYRFHDERGGPRELDLTKARF